MTWQSYTKFVVFAMAAMRLCKLCLPPSAAARAPSSTWLRKSPGSLLFRNHGISSYVIKATGLKAPNLEPELGGMGSKGISQKWNVKMLYDGECPLCMREVNMLSEKNKSYGTIKFIDISAAEYDPAENGGISYEMAMGKIHAILDDGTIITNVEAFKKLYEAVGLGWVYAITNYEPFASIAGFLYSVWAKYRLPLTGRPAITQILMEKQQRKGQSACNATNCDITSP